MPPACFLNAPTPIARLRILLASSVSTRFRAGAGERRESSLTPLLVVFPPRIASLDSRRSLFAPPFSATGSGRDAIPFIQREPTHRRYSAEAPQSAPARPRVSRIFR